MSQFISNPKSRASLESLEQKLDALGRYVTDPAGERIRAAMAQDLKVLRQELEARGRQTAEAVEWMTSLRWQRAEKAYDAYDFGTEVKTDSPWVTGADRETGHDTMSRTVFLEAEDGGEDVAVTFTVPFLRGTPHLGRVTASEPDRPIRLRDDAPAP